MGKVEQLLEQFTAKGKDTEGKVLGAALVVTDSKGVIYSKGSGRIDFPVDAAPYNDKSFNWVASLTKLLTSISVLQLVEKGLVTLDQDVRSLVPELRDAHILIEMDDNNKGVLEKNTKPITLRHLLTHTAGFSYEFANPTLLAWSRSDGRDLRRVQWSKKESDTPLCFAPGEDWEYGVSIDWAGQVLEKITGQTLGEYMQKNIWDPLGMKDTTFWPEKLPHTQTKDRKVKFSLRSPKTGALGPTDWALPEKHEMESGGGGLFTTAADYATVLRGLLQGRLLKPSTLKEMLTPQLNDDQREKLEMVAFHPLVHNTFAPEFPPGTKVDHGLAGLLNLHDVPGKRRAGSIAWSGIHNSRWWLDPKTGIGAVLLVNVRPHGDEVVAKLWDQLESAVYEEVVPIKGKI